MASMVHTEASSASAECTGEFSTGHFQAQREDKLNSSHFLAMKEQAFLKSVMFL